MESDGADFDGVGCGGTGCKEDRVRAERDDAAFPGGLSVEKEDGWAAAYCGGEERLG